MPKLKPSPIAAIAQTVQSNITARGVYFGCKTDSDYAERLNMRRSSYAEYRRDPKKWTVEQLAQVSIAFKCPISWLVTDHSGPIKEDKDT